MLEKFVTENDLGEVFYAPCDVHESSYLKGLKIELKGIF